jgi:hypothetical protein
MDVGMPSLASDPTTKLRALDYSYFSEALETVLETMLTDLTVRGQDLEPTGVEPNPERGFVPSLLQRMAAVNQCDISLARLVHWLEDVLEEKYGQNPGSWPDLIRSPELGSQDSLSEALRFLEDTAIRTGNVSARPR